MCAEEQDLVWVIEAMATYGHTRQWYMDQIMKGNLTSIERPGTTRVFLRRSEIEALAEKGKEPRPDDA